MDPTPGKTQAASDLPTRRPVIPQRPVAPSPQTDTSLDDYPFRPKPKLKFSSGGGRTIAACALCAFVGSLLGSVLTSNTTQARVDKTQHRLLISQSLGQLISAGADVRGNLTLPQDAESYKFKRIDLSDIGYATELRKAVRLSATLPGVTELNFFNPYKPVLNAGAADATVLAAVAEHFPVLDTLDVSCTNVGDFLALEGKTIRHLKIINTPMILESFTSLKFINGLSEVSIGWPDRTIPKDHLLRSEGFRKTLVDSLAVMIDLKKVNLYDVTLDKEDREKLAKLEISLSRLGDTHR